MSYDITNYAMRAVSMPDFLNALKAGVSVPIIKYGIYVMLDDKFKKLCELHMPKIFRESEYGTAKLIADNGFLETTSFDYPGPLCAFAAVIASACGLSDSTFYSPDNYTWNLPMTLKDDVLIFPSKMMTILLNGKQIKDTLVYIPGHSALQCFACFLSAKNILSVVSSNDENFSLSVPCLKTSLELLCKGHHNALGQDNSVIHSHMYWMWFLIDAFLKSKECYQSIEVLSSIYGDVHDYGGMKKDVPYLCIDGISSYDENGWDDPADSKPEVVDEIKTALFGKKSKIAFEKFTPKFGG
jgi:hypothetical protein